MGGRDRIAHIKHKRERVIYIRNEWEIGWYNTDVKSV
jgi:hypothetical protein